MKIFWIVIFLTFTNYFVQAQNYTREHLDSLYEKFVWLRTDTKNNLYNELIEVDPADRKCGFGIVSEIIHNLESFTTEQQAVLAKILQRPEKDTSMISPSGFFRIHYDTTGNEVPNYDPFLSVEEDVMQVALAADSSYNFEVNFLGYPPPPGDSIKNMDPSIFGGDNRYDIYITSARGYYGFTEFESFLGDQKYTTHIQIHYNYVGNFYTHGLNAMRVTVAHEFHHSIQLGNYTGDKDNVDGYFYEMTSTSMEEFVYDDVNDYYNYMSNYFDNPARPFGRRQAKYDGYDLAIWNIFLKDKFGYGIIKRQWELFTHLRALDAIVTSLNEAGTTFGSKFNEFGAWTFFTNYRTITGKYFEEAAHYPLIRSINTFDFNSQPVNGEAKPTSNNFITFINSTDTLVAIISNTDYISGVNDINGNFDYQYILSASSIEGSTKLTDNYFAKLNVDQPSFWTDAEILNNQLIRLDSSVFPIDLTKDFYAYPNPFYYNRRYSNNCDCIQILIDPKDESQAELNVYTPAMDLVYSASLPFENTNFGRKVLSWKDVRNLDLASGVYIYITNIGDETSVGKLVIFNE